MTQLRKTEMGILFATLVITLAMILLLATPGHTQETTLAEEPVEQVVPEVDASQSEQSASPSAEFTAAQETTTPSTAEDTTQQTTTPPTAESATQDTSEQPDGCRVVDTFSGSGETRLDTPFFTIVGPQWRVAYEAENIAPPPVGMLFAFFIRNERGQPLDPNGVVIESDQSGIENVNSDPGRYYIQIISSQVDWTLRVEDCGDQGGGQPGGGPPGSNEERREEVVSGSFPKKKLVNTGGLAILAPAAGLLLLSTAVLGLLLKPRR